jgi:hypothetical protein
LSAGPRLASTASTHPERRACSALEFQGRFAEALVIVTDASRPPERAPADRHMQLIRASALNGSAWNGVQLGDLPEARAFCLKAIELCQSIGYSPGEAGT